MKLFERAPSFFLALAVIVLGPGSLLAKTIPPLPAKKKDAIAFIQRQIELSDSIGDEHGSVDWRLELAGYCDRAQRELLYAELWQFEDSVPSLLDEMLALRLSNVAFYKDRKKWQLAAEENAFALDLTRRVVERNWAKHLDSERQSSRNAIAQLDSSIQRAGDANDSLSRSLQEREANTRSWRLIALTLAGALVVLIVLLVLRMRRQQRKMSAEIARLGAEIAALKEPRPTNKFRTEASTPLPVADPVVAPADPLLDPQTAQVAVDPIVLAMFKKMAPERLATLREARTRGDHEKVLRVVHSLKPQLVNFDMAFGELCARITAADAPENMALWSTDLDTLESGITTVLKKLDH